VAIKCHTRFDSTNFLPDPPITSKKLTRPDQLMTTTKVEFSKYRIDILRVVKFCIQKRSLLNMAYTKSIHSKQQTKTCFMLIIQEALLVQRNRATRFVSRNIMVVLWLNYWQEALLMQRNHASTLSVEIVQNAAQMFDGLHVKTSTSGEW